MLNKRLYAKTPTKVFPTAKIKERKRILKERLERRKKEKNYWPWYYSGEIFFMAADLIRDDKEWVLVLYLFNMMDKDNTPRYRTFITKDDYITQDLRQKNLKWITGGMESISYGFYYHSEFLGSPFLNTESRKLFDDFLKDYRKEEDKSDIWRLQNFQSKVRKNRLLIRYKKITDPIDKRMEDVGPLPKDFENWIEESAMIDSRYVFYDRKIKNHSKAFCTRCGKSFTIDRNKIVVENNRKGLCPKCGSPIKFKAVGHAAERISDERVASVFQRVRNGYVLRIFDICWSYNKLTGYRIREEEISESERIFLKNVNGALKFEDGYEYSVFRQSGIIRWNSMGDYGYRSSTLYDRNLPQEWNDTNLKYSALEILSRNMPGEQIEYRGIIESEGSGKTDEAVIRFLEMIIKMGMYVLAREFIDERHYYNEQRIQINSGTIYRMLKLDKQNMKIFQRLNGGISLLILMQNMTRLKIQLPDEDILNYFKIFGNGADLMRPENRKASIHKMIRYIQKEAVGYKVERSMYYQSQNITHEMNVANDWRDYLHWCKALKIDLDNPYNYFPKNLKAVHDRTYKDFQILEDKKAAAERKRQEALAKKRMEEVKALFQEMLNDADSDGRYLMKAKGLVLMVPESADDLRKEGRTNGNCVGTYVERVAKGETNILFIRKEDKPDKTFYTLEYKGGKIIQCRGKGNCDMTPEVEAFVKAFDKKYKEYKQKPALRKVS